MGSQNGLDQDFGQCKVMLLHQLSKFYIKWDRILANAKHVRRACFKHMLCYLEQQIHDCGILPGYNLAVSYLDLKLQALNSSRIINSLLPGPLRSRLPPMRLRSAPQEIDKNIEYTPGN